MVASTNERVHVATFSGVTVAWAFAPGRAERRALSRRLLSAVLTGVRPHASSLNFSQQCPRCQGPHGPLVIEIDGAPGPPVSVAYSGRLVVVAVNGQSDHHIGVDAEIDSVLSRTVSRHHGDTVRETNDLARMTRPDAVLKAAATVPRERFAATEFEPIGGSSHELDRIEASELGGQAIEAPEVNEWRATTPAEAQDEGAAAIETRGFDLLVAMEAAEEGVAAHTPQGATNTSEPVRAVMSIAILRDALPSQQ